MKLGAMLMQAFPFIAVIVDSVIMSVTIAIISSNVVEPDIVILK